MTVPHSDSVIRRPDGGTTALKVHRALWSGTFPPNSLAAIEESCGAGVARAEIDLQPLRDGGFLVFHDDRLDGSTDAEGSARALTRTAAARVRLRWRGETTGHAPPDLADVVEVIRSAEHPTIFELDLKELEPWSWDRVEALARLLAPIRDRILLGTESDWNLRRLLTVDPALPVSLNPGAYFDWLPGDGDAAHLPRGAYGYLDRHPLAGRRYGPVRDYLRDRFGGISRLVPGARELHLRLECFERMLDDGVADAAAIIHATGVRIDVWTLDAGSPGWEARFRRAVDAGADLVTTNTAPAMAAAARGWG